MSSTPARPPARPRRQSRPLPTLVILGFAGGLALAACGPRADTVGAPDAPAARRGLEHSAPPGADPAGKGEEPGADGGTGTNAGPGSTPGAATPRAYIAEAHTYRFTPPPDRLKPLWQKHLDACHRLGPAGCQVEEARLSADDDGLARSASLTVRVANAAAGSLLAGLDADAPREHAISRTDKTTEVIDTDARLANGEQLRARLQALRNAAGKLSDVIELETRIADVQGQIEASQGAREYLRQETERTKIELTYDASGRALDNGTWRPVREALEDIGTTLATTLGVLIRALTVLVPLGLVAGAGFWLVRALRRTGRRRPPPKPPA